MLTTFLDPSEAVAVMIIPLLAASLPLVGELDTPELKPCVVCSLCPEPQTAPHTAFLTFGRLTGV